VEKKASMLHNARLKGHLHLSVTNQEKATSLTPISKLRPIGHLSKNKNKQTLLVLGSYRPLMTKGKKATQGIDEELKSVA